MNETFPLMLIGIGGILTAAFITSNLSGRFGVPSLLLYLLLGVLFGNGGDHDFLFDEPRFVEHCSELSLGLILFKAGYEFDHGLWRRPRVLAEGLSLALFGTLFTALLTALAAHLFLGWPWLDSLLLGAVLSSTDAAAVFSVFQSTKLKTGKDTMEVLETESSTNDPLAFALVAGLVAASQRPELGVSYISLLVAQGLLLGILVGAAVGFMMTVLARYVQEHEGTSELLWLAVLTSGLGVAELVGANPLITAFTSGVVLSSRRTVPGRFWGPFVALAEVSLFVLLGLQVFPDVLWSHVGKATLITLALVFVSRPLAVMVVSSPFHRDLKRSLFLSWAGLRGASPIVFGLMPLIGGVPQAGEIFATVFVVVVVSVLLQGTSLPWVAARLGLVVGPSSPTSLAGET